MKLLAEGAEAKIFSLVIKGLPCVIKERIQKNYRLEEIDTKLRKSRTKHEISLLTKAARAKVNVPKILDLSTINKSKASDFTLCMEEIPGIKVRDYLLDHDPTMICAEIGKQVGRLHKADITHGDLTTSNMIFDGTKVFIIDLGLGQVSTRVEDKAVDLHLLKECLKSKHFDIWEPAWEAFSKSYKEECGDEAFKRLKEVELRGRYKHIG